MIYLTLFESPALGSDGSAVFSDRVWAVLGSSLCLTRRQIQVLREVFDDSTEYMMAANLGISIRTVRSHLGCIYRKLGARGRVALALCVTSEFIRLFGDPALDAPTTAPTPGSDRCVRQRPVRPGAPGLPLGGMRIPPW